MPSTAAKQVQDKTPVPSAMSSAEWEAMDRQLKDAALFSAKVESIRVLQRIQDGLVALLESSRDPKTGALTMDRAKLRMEIRRILASEGYAPPEGRIGTMEDLTSDARLNLILDVQMGHAQGYAYWKSGMDADVLNEWPAQRLVRLADRKEPRNWPQRWADAGGEMLRGQMVALKTDPIWVRISRFGKPFPPFDFQSGMGLEEIDRDEAESLGLLEAQDKLTPLPDDFVTGRKASVQGIDPTYVDWLKKQFGDRVRITDDGYAEWIGNRGGDAPPEEDAPPPAKPQVQPVKPVTQMPVDADIPQVDAADAREKLKQGIALQSPLGDAVRMDESVLEHWKDKPTEEADRRLRRLDDAIAAVESPAEIWEKNGQKSYLRITQDSTGKRFMSVFVEAAGRVVSFFHTRKLKDFVKKRIGKMLWERSK